MNFLQGIKCPESEAVVNVVCAQSEKYGTDFDAIISYLGQMVMKKGLIMQMKTRRQLVRTKVAAFMGKIECKK